jgi:hypothetical protein
MKYHWTTCPNCHCEVAVNFVDREAGMSGSLRRWSRDRSVNDGRPFAFRREELSGAGDFVVPCVCGQAIAFPAQPDAISAERDEGLRVKLGEPEGN